ncbi:aminotransferase class IV [Simkania negevensis]|uniref:branched-chain-amino-acid transaminase n=1 Tax=Simkania negevensis (strain ATCC VR-1471 / DSM 27360 / Z) TaxID=331113 RepID=F8L6C9_SIMNZ|nr:aminotransferase class IV [Simkania negevensis]CCB88259.1 putative branched-chain-amino-acid aminotransferase [Simkania negevensis Z]
MKGLVYIDGQILPAEEAKISVLDLSIMRGYGVFDFLRTYQKLPFRLWDHLKRFEASAKEIEIPLPLSMNEVVDVIEQLLEKAPYPEANIKIFLTGGQSTDQYLPEDRPTFFALVYPVRIFPKEMYEKGVGLVTEIYERPFPACKSIHYLPAIVAIRCAQRKGAHDVLFLSHNKTLLETGTANFFGIKGSTVVTTGEGIIFGITRQVILELLEEQGISVEVRTIGYDELQTFDGAFITSSSKEVVPVVQVDDISFPLHPLTITLMKCFSAYTKSIESPFQKVL